MWLGVEWQLWLFFWLPISLVLLTFIVSIIHNKR